MVSGLRSLLANLATSLLVITLLVEASQIKSAGHAGGAAACGELASKFPSLLFLPNTTTYTYQSHLPWSETCLLSPTCVFLPQNAARIAAALPIIRKARSPFAVISVLISMNQMTQLKFANYSSTFAQVEPGNTWKQVYDWLEPSGLAVNGGRYAQVGVGGLLLGGGIGYFSSKMGWGANSVVQYEVMLANSSVVLVNCTSHPDLFWALKGGSNNFGIVTRYDLTTLEIGDAFSNVMIWSSEATTQWFDALNAYLAPGGGVEDVNAAIMPIVALTPADGTYEVIKTQVGSWTFLAEALDIPAYAARDERQLFWAISSLPDPRAISIANHTVFDRALVDLRNVTGCSITLNYQPISKAWLEASKALGGDAINLDPHDGPFIAGLIASTWTNEDDDETVYECSRNAADSIRRQTEALGLHHPFIFSTMQPRDNSPLLHMVVERV
ncbi:FAD linked oxidase N-terminal [Penicillium malachiteum]|uniref:FAD linked oxidase N-terminal n=1 Tax=Penicillium malachiteum TaxID=1324776 RepID=UPI002546C0D6|nr:FAD linked oxidase N-terminal [Penicillium malachiteum]KAJ5735334.1 FAD linked oxidase N-terminal [Penicillium malachiteum]